jgi:hypothetical protein
MFFKTASWQIQLLQLNTNVALNQSIDENFMHPNSSKPIAQNQT